MISNSAWHIFGLFGFFIVLVFITGLYCILATRSLIRVLIGLELLIKAVTLAIILAGYVTGNTALAQSIVITTIVIEVVVVTVGGGIALSVFRKNDSLDTRLLKNLKG